MGSSRTEALSFLWLMLPAFGAALLARRLRIPYAVVLVATGLAVGAMGVLPRMRLDPALLFTLFLPPLLFEAALGLNWAKLKRSALPIVIFTFGGAIFSMMFCAAAARAWLHMPWGSALVWGALICATDPISVVAVFRKLGAPARLTLILEAESVFNDGVAVVLFTVALAVAGGRYFGAPAAIGLFVWLFVGGGLAGAAVGALTSRAHVELNDHLLEIMLSVITAFGSYFLADAMGCSGVMGVVCAGLVFGNRALGEGVSERARDAVGAFWEVAAFAVNSVVFLLIGMEAARLHWSVRILAAALAAIIALCGRSVIYPLSFAVNRMGGRIPRPWQHLLVWGGLRGALSMALALGLSPGFPARDRIISATFAAVLFTLIGQGITVGPLLRRMRLAEKGEEPAHA